MPDPQSKLSFEPLKGTRNPRTASTRQGLDVDVETWLAMLEQKYIKPGAEREEPGPDHHGEHKDLQVSSSFMPFHSARGMGQVEK